MRCQRGKQWKEIIYVRSKYHVSPVCCNFDHDHQQISVVLQVRAVSLFVLYRIQCNVCLINRQLRVSDLSASRLDVDNVFTGECVLHSDQLHCYAKYSMYSTQPCNLYHNVPNLLHCCEYLDVCLN